MYKALFFQYKPHSKYELAVIFNCKLDETDDWLKDLGDYFQYIGCKIKIKKFKKIKEITEYV